MLGVQSWYTALAVPTIVVGGFVASRKRLAYQWREELMDPEGITYPTVTDADMEFVRRVAPAAAVEAAEALATPLSRLHSSLEKGEGHPQHRQDDHPHDLRTVADAYGVALTAKDNIGLSVRSDVLSPEVGRVLLNEVRRWSQALGNALDSRKIDALVRQVETADSTAHEPSPSLAPPDLDVSFLRHVRCIADHAEDIQSMKAPWGSGDRIRLEEMPASLRYLVERTSQTFEGIGRLRHVYIEYSPTGRFYRAPRPPKAYDGHDYVIIPLRRDGEDAVVTMSPVFRSRVSNVKDVARHSWTSRDIDALVPHGCMLRVYGSARYEWGWGIRPGPTWFGSRINGLCRDRRTEGHVSETPVPLGSRLKRLLTSRPTDKPQRADRLSPSSATAPTDAALVVLHFEGPRAAHKQRSLLLQPEIFIFGRAPTVEAFETWRDDRPSIQDVRAEGLLRFMIRHYREMLTVS